MLPPLQAVDNAQLTSCRTPAALPAAQHTSFTQVYQFTTGTVMRHERRAMMACLLLPPGLTLLYALLAAVLLKLRRGLGYAVSCCKWNS